jgi:PIN domain nuclease of toxin-antitoxin system
MKLLLDTHVLLWAITGDRRLSENACHLFLDKQNDLYLSLASLWEICIKISLGKIQLVEDWFLVLRQEMSINAIRWLSIEANHCLLLQTLPFHHRDPFDRLLVAQALAEKMTLLSHDPQLSKYAVNCVW